MADPAQTLLHPLSSLEWQKWPPLPVEVADTSSVWLTDTIFVGGGCTTGDDARLYSFKPGVDIGWSFIKTPTRLFSLIAHNSELLLVGGYEQHSGERSNKIYTYKDGVFTETQPPMTEKRSQPSLASTGDVLVVAGGEGDSGDLHSVEFLQDGRWKTASSLPRGGYGMTSAQSGDQWILVDYKTVYSVSLSSLISGTEHSPWKTLPDAPNNRSAVTFSNSLLLSIGGDLSDPTPDIYAFSTVSESWVQVAELHIPLCGSSASHLPTGELVIIGGRSLGSVLVGSVFIGQIKCTLVDPETSFSLPQLFSMDSCDVKLIESLSKNPYYFHVISDVRLVNSEKEQLLSLSARDYLKLIFEAWERSKRPTYPATWEGLFTVLRKMDLGHLVQQIAKIVSRIKIQQSQALPISTRSLPNLKRICASDMPGQSEDRYTYQQYFEPHPLTMQVSPPSFVELEDLYQEIEELQSKSCQLEDRATGLLEHNDKLLESNKDLQFKIAMFRNVSLKGEKIGSDIIYEVERYCRYHQEHFAEFPPESESEPFPSAPRGVEMADSDCGYQSIAHLSTIEQGQDQQLEMLQQAVYEDEVVAKHLCIANMASDETPSLEQLGTATEEDITISYIHGKNIKDFFALPGVEVAGRATVEVTNSAQSFSWDDHGLNLHVPQDSLPAGVSLCRLDLMSSTGGLYQPPSDQEQLSPVYWVRPTPLCRFQKPLTLEIQHCAKMTSTTELTFLKATCTQKTLPYVFKEVKEASTFSTNSSFGSLEIFSFSGYTVGGRDRSGKKVKKLYKASFYHRSPTPECIEIYFVIALDHKLHLNKLKKQFRKLKAEQRLTFPVVFKEKQICLDIAFEGISVGGWKLEPMTDPPEIRQAAVGFHEYTEIPYLELNATLSSDCTASVPACTVPIALKGAESPKHVKIKLDAFTPTVTPLVTPVTPALLPVGQFPISNHSRSLTSHGTMPGTVPSVYQASYTHQQYFGAHPLTMQGGMPWDNYGQEGQGREIQIPGPSRAAELPLLSIDELVNRVGIDKELLDREVSDQHLKQISALLPHWRQYAVALGLSRGHIIGIDDNKQLQYDMKTNEVLYLWKNSNPFKATFTTLVETCLRERDNEAAKRICEMAMKGQFH